MRYLLNYTSLSPAAPYVRNVVVNEYRAAIAGGAFEGVRDVAKSLNRSGRSKASLRPISFPTWSLRSLVQTTRAILQSALIFPLHRLVCHPFRVEGREHLRDITPPVLFIANHTSHLDTPSILRALPFNIRARTAVAAAGDYFYRIRFLGILTSLLLNTFPFSRHGSVRPSLEYCGDLVKSGWSVLIYPEGTRSTNGTMQQFRSGVGLLARQMGVPVVPIAVEGGHKILPKGRLWPKRGPMTVRIGAPVCLFPSKRRQETAARLEQAVIDLMQQPALTADYSKGRIPEALLHTRDTGSSSYSSSE